MKDDRAAQKRAANLKRQAILSANDEAWLLRVGFRKITCPTGTPCDGYEMLDSFGQCAVSVGEERGLRCFGEQVDTDGKEPTKTQVLDLCKALRLTIKNQNNLRGTT